jgi:hypothetical protein
MDNGLVILLVVFSVVGPVYLTWGAFFSGDDEGIGR